MINKISKALFSASRASRDANAVAKAVSTGSVTPIAKRLVNKMIGKHIVSKLWWK